ncbi:MAG: hypothetical protein D6798_03670 [Deltaproteobacteria bacterium]|nr:MAG: hypothetical protein D6798_03670 [Deltaproteobacteria bacterium]
MDRAPQRRGTPHPAPAGRDDIMHAHDPIPGPSGALLPPHCPPPYTGPTPASEGGAGTTDPMPDGSEPRLVEPGEVPAPSMAAPSGASPCPGLDRLWQEEDSGDAFTWSVDDPALGFEPAEPDAEPWLEPDEAEPWLEPEPTTGEHCAGEAGAGEAGAGAACAAEPAAVDPLVAELPVTAIEPLG